MTHCVMQKTCVVEPSQRCEGTGTDLTTLPYVILIDGLDECTGEDRQAELLTAVKEGLLVNGLPFRIFIASRPEWAIRTALEPGGHLRNVAYHIQLSDNYDASSDMRRYLQRRFEDIGLRIGNSHWFTEDNIETLVTAASGQFVYVATVFKYISERRASPAGRLKIVLDWTPHEGQKARPFECLDRLYANILLAAKNAYEAVDTHSGHDFLLLFNAHHLNAIGIPTSSTSWLKLSADSFSVMLGLEAGAQDNLVTDLRSLVTLEMDMRQSSSLRMYHKSFSDFLEEESRAKDLFVPKSRIYTHLAMCCLQNIVKCPLDFDSLPAKWEELPLPEARWHYLRDAAEVLPYALNRATADINEVADFTNKDGWSKLDKLLPLAYDFDDSWGSPVFLDEWITNIGRFIDRLKVSATVFPYFEAATDIVLILVKSREPEIAALMSEIVGMWKRHEERTSMNSEMAGTDWQSVSGYSSDDVESEAS
ncbi:hypothetical protein EST38_g8120 [Candolleomyces aberdarensis]|uniref:NACHT domain-containing protein n=1 Tax=Candolleomyces aberdarensis TaxID=2316362 RepID=A0A4Q2DG76_9AGAR|nr:hypothetical protein EST38_g8120 [Candolleomyces aberdarensis]